MQHRALVHGNVLGLVALDLILRIVLGTMARVTLILGIAGINLDDPASDMARFGIPTDVVTDLEFCGHEFDLSLGLQLVACVN